MIAGPGAAGDTFGTIETSLAPTSRGRTARISIPGLLAVTFLVLLVLVALFAPWVARVDPNAQDLEHAFAPPGLGHHLLGTDQFGRDQLARLVYGARVSLIAIIVGTSVAIVIGVPVGMLAGYLGGVVEAVVRFVFDGLMSVPSLILALTVIAILGTGLVNAMIAVGIVISPPFFRLARASTMDVGSQTFIEASRAIGCSTWRLLVRHVLPNSITPIIIQGSVASGYCVVAEASLSYLGLGVREPAASWGSMLTSASENLFRGSFLIYAPGIAVAVTVLALMVTGDWLREVFAIGRRTET